MKQTIAKGIGRYLIVASLLSTFIVLANAADAARHPRVRHVNARAENQQDRIAQGVTSGQLTSRETARLEVRESRLKQTERYDRAADGGHLTQTEAAQLNHRQNKLSRSIYSQKHDAQTETTTPKPEVGGRVENQQDRIAAGIKSGALTPAEASRLEARETYLRGQIASDRNANGGKLTDAERSKINAELNGISSRIYTQKHDAQTQPQ
ncbi:MAG: hypothetical protein M3R59_06110 [Verrucomicrobiota bacterium]|nr:hypothetical protein [Verrucomicrobiota bacterium]